MHELREFGRGLAIEGDGGPDLDAVDRTHNIESAVGVRLIPPPTCLLTRAGEPPCDLQQRLKVKTSLNTK